MQIRYELTMEDVYAFNRYHGKNDLAIKRSRRMRFAMIGLMSVLILVTNAKSSQGLELDGIFLSMMALLMALYWWQETHGFKRQLRKWYDGEEGRGLIGTRTLEITEEGITDRSEYYEAKIAWGMISRIESAADYTFLFTGKAQGYVVPHHAVTEGSLPAFLQTLGERYKPDGKLQVPNALQTDRLP